MSGAVLTGNIRLLCVAHNISIYELERKAGLANGIIGKWEKHTPKVNSLKAVADVFGVTVDELITPRRARKGVKK